MSASTWVATFYTLTQFDAKFAIPSGTIPNSNDHRDRSLYGAVASAPLND